MSFMKTLIALAMLLARTSLIAQTPSDTVTIHVSASHWIPGQEFHSASYEKLTAVINGKRLELEAFIGGPFMLQPGDYRARLVGERRQSPNELAQTYEILLPGNKSRKFDVVGIEE